MADFAVEHPETFQQWKNESNSIISLSVPAEQDLKDWYTTLVEKALVTYFVEPDIDDQWTSICLYAEYDVRKLMRSLPLALNNRRKKVAA